MSVMPVCDDRRLHAVCQDCRTEVSAPSTDLGRSIVAAFIGQHQHAVTP